MRKEATFKKWQLISWEPELFVSGGLILTLLNVEPILVEWYNWLSPFRIPGLMVAFTFLSATLASLTIGFVLHLITRGLWIVYMGLASAINKPYDSTQTRFKPYYLRRVSDTDIHQKATHLGRISSLIFSITFFLMLISLGASVATTLLLLILPFIGLDESLTFLILSVLLVDFVSLGWLKKSKIGLFLIPLLIPLYWISLSFLYRDIYYYLIQHVHKMKLIVGFVCFTVLSVTLGFFNVWEMQRRPPLLTPDHQYELFENKYYDDRREPYSVYDISIDSYLQDKSMLQIFIRSGWLHDEIFRKDALKFYIDHQAYGIKAIRNTFKQEKEYGYLLFVDISRLSPGEHLILFKLDESKIGDEFSGYGSWNASFPFFYSKD
ncbi:hypothetical protein [Marinoscillum sp.]|uniref:hypothetical protein n=1 Tax=Marinoscillum sp. TaxID=2024838 RepID=UPI003BA89A47